VEDQRHSNKEERDKDPLEHSNCMDSKSSNLLFLMRTVSMTICNLFHADGAIPVGSMCKPIQVKLNSSQAQTELTVSVSTMEQRCENLTEVLIVLTSTRIVVSKHHMVDSLILQSK